MARQLHRLAARTVATLKTPGRHSDGGGLVLHVDDKGRRRWTFRFRWGQRVRDMGLGAFPAISLADARKAAEEARRLLAKGIDPIAARSKVEAEKRRVTFAEAADELIGTFEGSWKNAKHRQQWRNTIDTYCAPLKTLAVAEVSTADVLGVLKPIWQTKPETANRLRGRIERVLALAKVRGWRSGENPGLWRGHLDQLLPRPRRLSRGHHKAMPYPDVPAFIKKLRDPELTGALALEFAILTAARTSEVTGAKWEEFDLNERVWTVPADRMKAKRVHRVPLSDRAVAIVERMAEGRCSEFVFPGRPKRVKHGPLSQMAMQMAVRRAKATVTVHGFRSSFRDWSAEVTNFPNEVAEAALAHVVSDKVEAAYRRGDLFQKRRALMDAWSSFIDEPPAGNVLAFSPLSPA